MKRPGWVSLLAVLMSISGLGMMGWSLLNQHPVAELQPQKPTQQFFGHYTVELSADRTYNIYNPADWDDRSCYVADESAIDPSEDATEVRRLPRDTDSGVVVRDREWRAVRTFQVARTGTYTVWCESD